MKKTLLFLEKSFFKIIKTIYLWIPVVVIAYLLLSSNINFHALTAKKISSLMENNTFFLICAVVILVIYYKATKFFFYILPIFAVLAFFLAGSIDFNGIITKIILGVMGGSITYIILAVVILIVYYFLVNFISRKFFVAKGLGVDMTRGTYTFETNLVAFVGTQTTGAGIQVFPTYFPVEEMNIRTYKDADEKLTDFKTFDFDYTSKTNPLLEKELFKLLEKVLQKHGLSRSEKNPQITISMDFYIGKKEQYTPPTTVTSTELKSVWNYGMIGWNVGGFTSQVPVTSSSSISGYTTTSYYSNIRLNFLNHEKLLKNKKTETPPLIWLGETDEEGFNQDIRGIAPIMFEQLLNQFSDDSANSHKYAMQRYCYSGLGLGFDTKNWHIVRYVEPGSVAAGRSIKPGDVLITVNDKPVLNWPSFSKWRSTSMNLYRSKDPYFQNILSNRNGTEVEVKIRMAETGRETVLKMKPRSEDRYVQVSV